MKKFFCFLLSLMMVAAMLTGCGNPSASTSSDASKSTATPTATNDKNDDKKASIVCTNFAEYDFARQIAGDKADVKLLLKPGAEVHTYEPTPQDMITIQNCNMFIYVGGDSDEWVSKVLDSMDKKNMTMIKMMDCVKLVEETLSEGMEAEKEEESDGEEEGPEMDEHVWTSPANAIKIVQNISDKLCKIDEKNADTYKSNTTAYTEKLQKLDDEFKDVVANGKRKEIIVGDRFPFRYFCEEFGLKYYAAFPGCSTDTEASPATIAFLIDKVKQDSIPVVFHIELSNAQMCKSISDATGAKSELLNAIHNVSADDFKAGVTYIDLMEHNVKVLKEALN